MAVTDWQRFVFSGDNEVGLRLGNLLESHDAAGTMQEDLLSPRFFPLLIPVGREGRVFPSLAVTPDYGEPSLDGPPLPGYSAYSSLEISRPI